MVTTSLFLNSEIKQLSLKDLEKAVRETEGVVWVDLDQPDRTEEETVLTSLFNFHPLAIEDCRRGAEEEGHHPKVEDFGGYLFVIINPVECPSPEDHSSLRGVEIRTSQLSAFLSRRVQVTHHYKPLSSIQYARQLLSKNPQALGRGPDFLFHIIIDDVVDNYTPLLDNLDEAVDRLEEEVFHVPGQRTMVRILNLKRNIQTIRRVAVYQREMLNRLSRGEFALITPDEMIYYRNVYDHLVRMTDLAESYRDIVAGLLDAYLSVTSNNLNRVMKVLTIISTIFLPLSVITGFFGMNFRYLPGLDWEYGALVATVFMVAVAIGMLWVFKRNKWL